MKYDFTIYQPKTGKDKNYIKINKNLTVTFPNAFLIENKLTGSKFVQFNYDRKNNVIAFCFSNIQIANSFKLNQKTRLLATQSAFKFAELYPKKGFMRFGAVGSPDIIAVINGQYVGIECKMPKGKQSPGQKEFEKNLIQAGGKYLLIRSIEDLIKQI